MTDLISASRDREQRASEIQGSKDLEIGEELIVDIERYEAHPSCDALVG